MRSGESCQLQIGSPLAGEQFDSAWTAFLPTFHLYNSMHTVRDKRIVQDILYAAMDRRDTGEECFHTPSALLLAEPAPQAAYYKVTLASKGSPLCPPLLCCLLVHAITCMTFYHLVRFSQRNGARLTKAPGFTRLLISHHHRRPPRSDTSAFLERWTPGSRRMTGQALTLEQRKEITTKEYEGFKHNFPEVLRCPSESI